jgi:glycosyltransferase involved in cell wall biosynthesis
MKIVLIPGRNVLPALGGQGSFCRHLAEGLIHLGHDISIIGEPGWSEVCRCLGAKLRDRLSPEVLRAAGIVHVNGPGRRAAFLALALRRPLVMTHQDYSYLCPASTAWTPDGCAAVAGPGPCERCPRQGFRSVAATRGLRRLCHHATNVAVSRSLFESLQLPNGSWILSPVASRPAPGPGTDGLLMFAGRLAPEKGIELLLQAVAKVPGAHLEIAGDGPLRVSLEALAHSLGIANRARFHGWLSLDRIGDLHRRAAAVCVPSLWPEPFGYVAAEAMAAARPVVGADGGAFRELLGDGRGWLCPPSVDAWAAALTEALADPGERSRRAERALHFVCSELDPVNVARRYLRVYERAAG